MPVGRLTVAGPTIWNRTGSLRTVAVVMNERGDLAEMLERLARYVAIDVEVSVPDRELLTGQTGDPLDGQLSVGKLQRYQIASAGRTKCVGEAIH